MWMTIPGAITGLGKIPCVIILGGCLEGEAAACSE